MSFEIIGGNGEEMPQMADFAKETSENAFEKDVIVASINSPVLAVFYTGFNASCAQFVDIITNIAASKQGKIGLIKVSVDKCPAVAQAMQIQNIPTVYAFYQGQAIDGFAGMMPEAEVGSFIDKIIAQANPQPVQQKEGLSLEEITKIMAEADELFFDENYDTAMEKYSLILEDDENNIDALAGIGWCLSAHGDMESVREMLSNIEETQLQGDRIKSLNFIANIKSSASVDKLQAKLDENNLDDMFELAKAYIEKGEFEQGVESLVKIIAKDKKWKDRKAHKFLIEFFEKLGNSHPIAKRGKRKLSAILFS